MQNTFFLAEWLIYETLISDRQRCCKLQPGMFIPSRHKLFLFPHPPNDLRYYLPSPSREAATYGCGSERVVGSWNCFLSILEKNGSCSGSLKFSSREGDCVLWWSGRNLPPNSSASQFCSCSGWHAVAGEGFHLHLKDTQFHPLSVSSPHALSQCCMSAASLVINPTRSDTSLPWEIFLK